MLYTTGQLTPIDVRGAPCTPSPGIDNTGGLVGDYSVANSPAIFESLATPVPEPAAFLPAACALLASALLRRRRA